MVVIIVIYNTSVGCPSVMLWFQVLHLATLVIDTVYARLHGGYSPFTCHLKEVGEATQVSPKNEIERLFNVVVIMSAMVIFSTFISAITNAMNQLRNLNRAFTKWTLGVFFHEANGTSRTPCYAAICSRTTCLWLPLAFRAYAAEVSAPLKARVLQSIKALSKTSSRVFGAQNLMRHGGF